MAAVNLRHIEIFHAVMTAGNLTEAARLLHTSQPTVSRELARFEKVLGLTLFERTRGRLHPTVQGLRLFEEVQRSGMGWIASSARRKVCASSVRASSLSPACRSFHNPFAAATTTISGALSGCQPEYCAAGVAVAGRVALRPAPRLRADGDASCPGRNNPYRVTNAK